MLSRLAKLLVPVLALLLLAFYFYMNYNKLVTVSQDIESIVESGAALDLRLELSGETVFQKRLKTSEIFDAAGVRKIYFVHLPKDVFARTKADMASASLEIQQQATGLTATQNASALLAVTEDKRVYLLDEDELKYMMTVIWNERLRAGTIVQCQTPGLCKSVNIGSNDWGPVQGPFLDTEYVAERRGLPKGRWAKGPASVLQIESASQQKVWMQINLLGVLADQELRFRGAATGVQKVKTDAPPVTAAGRELYPAIYLLQLDLKPGVNYLELSFSKWLDPAGPGANPLAAYLVAIGLKE